MSTGECDAAVCILEVVVDAWKALQKALQWAIPSIESLPPPFPHTHKPSQPFANTPLTPMQLCPF